MPPIPQLRNWALEPEVRRRAEQDLWPLIVAVREDRRLQEVEWAREWDLWAMQPSERRYRGRTDVYLPAARKAIRTLVALTHDLLFDLDCNVLVEPRHPQWESYVQGIQAAQLYWCEHSLDLENRAWPFLWQYWLHGNSPVKLFWEHKTTRTVRPVTLPGAEAGVLPTVLVEDEIDLVNGPRFVPQDLFLSYVYPVTATEPDELLIQFGITILTWDQLRERAQTVLRDDLPDDPAYRLYVNLGQIKEHKLSGAYPTEFQERVRRTALRGMDQNLASQSDLYHLQEVTEVYTTFPLPVEISEDEPLWEDRGALPAVLAFAGDGTLIRAQHNPFHHKQCPTKWARNDREVGHFYGSGVAKLGRKLQVWTNDIACQAFDILQWIINPVAVLDPVKIGEIESIQMRPGARWIADPTGVKFDRPPQDVAITAFNGLGQLYTLTQDSMDAPPQLLGQSPPGQGRGSRTLGGMQILTAAALKGVRSAAKQIVRQVFDPMLQWNFLLAQEFMEDDLWLRIGGPAGARVVHKRFTPAELVGDYDFRWVAGHEVGDKRVRAQQMLTFLNLISKLPPLPDVEIRWPLLLRRVWKEGLGQGDDERIVIDRTPPDPLEPELEHDLMRFGYDVEPSPREDMRAHLTAHMQGYAGGEGDGDTRRRLDAHIQATLRLFAASQMQAGMAMRGGMPGQPGGPNGGRGQPGAKAQEMRAGTSEAQIGKQVANLGRVAVPGGMGPNGTVPGGFAVPGGGL